MRTTRSIVFLTAVCAVLLSTAAFPQADVSTASLRGTVSDETGALVANAEVKVTSAERGVEHTVTTSASGVYLVPFLTPGVYDVRIQSKGFETHILKGVQLTVGQIAVFDVQLRVGAVSAEVFVTTEAPLVEVERTQQANTIQTRQVENLPNINRNFYNYVYTLPGVASSNAPRAQGNGNFNFGSSGFSIGGSNGRSNLITIDGGENEYGSGQARSFISPEAVQEFQVNRNAFAAEYGFTSGTAVNVITKGGTNEFHGGLFAYFRDMRTSARSFFDRRATKAYDQEFYPGGTFGGPIVKNKLFFFTSIENPRIDGARFRNYSSDPALLKPTVAQAAYLLALNNSGNANLQRIAGILTPLLSPSTFPDTLALLRREEAAPTNRLRDFYWTTRVDYQINSTNSINARFGLFRDHSDGIGNNNLVAPSNATTLTSRDYTTAIAWTHNLRPDLINQLRVQFSPKNSARTLPADPNGAELIISGLMTAGRSFTAPFNTFQDRYQFEDNLSWIKGKHFLKFGASYRPVHYHVINELWFGGQWTFGGGFPIATPLVAADQAALAAFGAPIPTVNPIQAFSLGLPSSVRQGFGTPEWQDWAKFLGVFAQDSWKITPHFTLDAGVRFDSDAEPKPLQTYNTVSPRVGFAWDPWGNGKTVIRGGGGIFYAPVYYQVDYLTNILNDSGKYINQTLLVTPVTLWAAGVKAGKLPFTGLSAADFNALGFATGPKNSNRVIFEAAKDYKNTYSLQGSFGISRRLWRDMALDVAYQVYRGVHIQLDQEINYKQDGTQVGPNLGPHYVRIDPTIAQFNNYSSIGNSIYHGMTASLSKRYSANSQFLINYTFSKAIDDVTDYNSAFAAFLPDNLRNERAVSSFNIKHNFVASGVFNSPWKAGTGNPLASIFADITLSPVIFMRSGIPFTVLVSAADVNGDTHPNDRPLAAGRNTGLGENFYGVEMRLNKQLYINRDRGFRVEFIAEATNLFNHTNFLSVNNNIGRTGTLFNGPNYNLRGDRSVSPSSPLGFTTADDPRRIQFGLKIAF